MFQIAFARPKWKIWLPFSDFKFKSFQTRTFFIFPGAKAQIFGAKKEIVSVPYFTGLGTLLENSFCVLSLYSHFC